MRRWRRRRSRPGSLAAGARPFDETRLAALVDEQLAAGAPTGWFEPAYRAAAEHQAALPWAAGVPHPYLTDWLAAPVTQPPGARAVVVGAGLGDDAAAVADAGYSTIGLDLSPTAVAEAQRRHERHGRGIDRGRLRFEVADLLDLPAAHRGGYDLVVEVHTVPWLPGVVREAAMAAIASLAAPGGVVVAITVLAADAARQRGSIGPPWPQAPSELAAYRVEGLDRVALEHAAVGGEPWFEARITFQRPGRT